VLEPEDTISLMKAITPERNQQEIQEEGGTDFGFAFGDAARFRVAVFKAKGNISMVLRQIPNKLLSFDDIGLPAIVKSLCRRPRGLFLVTGPTGSGKTTTLATMIDYINSELDHHIITIEDPIEYYHKHKKSMVNQREVGTDVPSFAEALRRALRQDPDVILVGELRDLETMESAIRAAETGHLVFGTLHTTGAQGTISRIADQFPVNQQEQIRVQLSTNLIAVLSQALLPRTTTGRVAAYEFMVVTPAISNLIRENKVYRINSSIQTGKKYGMQLLDDHLWILYENSIISVEEMLDKAQLPGQIKQKLDALHPGWSSGGYGPVIGGDVNSEESE
jgi:twitching motility protein PilT